MTNIESSIVNPTSSQTNCAYVVLATDAEFCGLDAVAQASSLSLDVQAYPSYFGRRWIGRLPGQTNQQFLQALIDRLENNDNARALLWITWRRVDHGVAHIVNIVSSGPGLFPSLVDMQRRPGIVARTPEAWSRYFESLYRQHGQIYAYFYFLINYG